jgi:hypothetical protein
MIEPVDSRAGRIVFNSLTENLMIVRAERLFSKQPNNNHDILTIANLTSLGRVTTKKFPNLSAPAMVSKSSAQALVSHRGAVSSANM